ncbi:hypothetical protein AMK26_07500 [Streptomyces sp. CB03234]|uniref:hypothetical protein n=1 Tax=Streptomyces sp. (strain CB03234) TaxID=1703937 RepID=UPI000938F8A2|nr:hypothetical protein [Streptomyces sp. CB03234]OKK05934.1 hypothetical protein AMK26_07500 [Streptomyces sp. CB03234]
MPDFRRPFEWVQDADRHTQLIDPVLTVRQLSRFDFARKSLTRIDHALVFATPKGTYDAYLPPRRPSRSEAAAKRYTAVYEVDMGVHPVRAEIRLPSDNDAFEFGVVAELSWQVVDPARFVESGHRDVPRLLLGELEQAARPVARRFPIAESAAAERELLDAVTGRGPLGAAVGLTVTWTVRLRRDQENIDHQLRLQAIDHAATEQIFTERRGMEYDVALDARSRQHDALQVGRAMEYGRQEQELVLQQQAWQHERAMLEARQAVEMQQIEAQKIAFYQWHLQQGGVQAWALHLAQHPEDSRLVMESMREDQLRLIQAQMDLVGQLLGSEGAENYELEGPKQLALRAVSDILNQRLPGVAQDGPPQLPGGQEYPQAATPQPEPAQGTPPLPPQQAPQPGAPQGAPSPGRPPFPGEPGSQQGPPLFPPRPGVPQGPPPFTPQSGVPQGPPPFTPQSTRPTDAVPPFPAQPGHPAHPAHTAPAQAPAQAPGRPAHTPPDAPQHAAAGTFQGWQPPPGYGSAPVMPPPPPTQPQAPAPAPAPESGTAEGGPAQEAGAP